MVETLRWRAAHDGGVRAFTIIVDGEQEEVSLSFAELDHRARGIAGRLQTLGKKGDRALLLCPDSLEYIAGMFGCLYTGLVVVPAFALDLQAEAERLTGLVAASGAEVGVTTQEMLPQVLAIPSLSRLRWVAADEGPEESAGSWTEPEIAPEDLALVVFTSGSTAEPKGIMITHEYLTQAGANILAYADPHGAERFVVMNPPHFAAGTMGLIYPLYAGVPITRLPASTVSARPARWLETLSRTGATMSGAANYLFDLSIHAIPPEKRDTLDLSAVRLLSNAGEAVRPDTITHFEEYFAPCGLRPGTIRPAYGMSEGFGASPPPGSPLTVVTVDRVLLQRGEVVHVPPGSENGRQLLGHGAPAPDMRLEIVDPDTLRRCEPGKVGEIWGSGPTLTKGYWNRPEETRAVFDAYLADTGEGPFFRTGDLGFLDQGELFIAGRLKEMIIIRGRNLYPADLEASLQHAHPAIAGRPAVAFALDVGDDERLAIVQEVDEHAAGEAGGQIISAIRQTISARHGVRANTVVLAPQGAIPRPGQWKLGRTECRKRLVAGTLPVLVEDVLDRASPQLSASYVAPRTETEWALAGIWQRVLGVPQVGIHDAFADLGGDSLLSMQVLLAADDAGLNVRVEDIHHHGTIADLAHAVETRREKRGAPRGPRVGQIPLLPRQLSLLRRSKSRSPMPMPAVFEALQPLNDGLLERSIQHLHFHHDALRLRCTRTARGWTGEYAAHTRPDLVTFRDVSSLPEPRQRERIAAEIRTLCESLDVTQGPLLRALHLRLGADSELLVLAVDHIVSDAYSISILTRDLDTLYRQLAAGEPPTLPPPTATVEEWQEESIAFAHSKDAVEEAAYWSTIASSAPTALPLDFPAHPRQFGQEDTVRAQLGDEATGRLRQLQRHGVGLSDAVHYAVARALGHEVACNTVQLWTVNHGRASVLPTVDLSRTVGFLVRGYPVSIELPKTGDELAAVEAVKQRLDQIPHQGMGFEVLANYSPYRRVRQLLTRAAPPIRLNYTGDMEWMSAGLTVFRPAEGWEEDLARDTTSNHHTLRHSHLDVLTGTRRGQLDVRIMYHDRAYLRPTVERFAGRIVDALERLAASPER
jgi:non-ribosomal peptide synthase protein (TIGR01720 family)